MRVAMILLTVLTVLNIAIAGEEENPGYEKLIQQELAGVKAPGSIDSFSPVFHHTPVNQDTTSICWSFATTSFIESELARMGKPSPRLSVISPVYYAFGQKSIYFAETNGTSRFAPGDLFPTVFRAIRDFGAVPAESYTGKLNGCATHNHDELYDRLDEYTARVTDDSAWAEIAAGDTIRALLDQYVGTPPETFVFEGSEYTPRQFAEKYVDLPWQDYLLITSFSGQPYDTLIALDVPDNWRSDTLYFNVPLDVFYNGMKTALQNGYSVAFDGDISEPGRRGEADVVFLPRFDFPAEVTPAARDYRFYEEITTDDHLMHMVGFTEYEGHDWFLVKDSWRDAFEGKHAGYFLYRDDFVKLKTLAYLVHKDAVPEIVARIPAGLDTSIR